MARVSQLLVEVLVADSATINLSTDVAMALTATAEGPVDRPVSVTVTLGLTPTATLIVAGLAVTVPLDLDVSASIVGSYNLSADVTMSLVAEVIREATQYTLLAETQLPLLAQAMTNIKEIPVTLLIPLSVTATNGTDISLSVSTDCGVTVTASSGIIELSATTPVSLSVEAIGDVNDAIVRTLTSDLGLEAAVTLAMGDYYRTLPELPIDGLYLSVTTTVDTNGSIVRSADTTVSVLSASDLSVIPERRAGTTLQFTIGADINVVRGGMLAEVVLDLEVSVGLAVVKTNQACRPESYSPDIGSPRSDDPSFNPSSSLTSGSVVLGYPFNTSSLSLTLRHTQLGDVHNIGQDRVNIVNRGNVLAVIDKPTWPKIETLSFTCFGICDDDIPAVQLFLDATAGREIKLVDWNGLVWKGVILNPDADIVKNPPNKQYIELQFQGFRQ